MPKVRWVLALIGCLVGLWAQTPSRVHAQAPPSEPTVGATAQSSNPEPIVEDAPARGANLRVFLMTMGPGPAVWERFGHNAILIQDELSGRGLAYNYGMFSFEQENFLLRFIRGEMDYWTEAFDAQLMADWYIQADRSVWLQELNLTPAQRADLQDFLIWNALPENRIYRYDYYYDNCSTRVRDAIDRVLGGAIQQQTGDVSAGTTYRQHTRALTAADPLLYTGLMLGLGQPVDREITIWEEMFLPMQLRERINSITITDGTGARVPLVLGETELYASTQQLDQSVPGSRIPIFLVLGLAIGGVVGGLGWRTTRGGGHRAFVWSTVAWCTVAGVLGLVLAGLWAFTDHEAAYRNENLFFASVLLLPLSVMIPRGFRRGANALRLAAQVAIAAAGVSVVGLILQALPAFDQVNGEIIALMLPVSVAIAAALLLASRSDRLQGGNAEPLAAVKGKPG